MTIYYNTKQSVATKVIAKPPQLAVAAAAVAAAAPPPLDGSAQWRWRQQVLYPTKQRSLHKEKDTELFKADYKVLC